MKQQSITRMVRKVTRQGTSVGVTLPIEFGFNAGEYVKWDVTDDGKITLSRVDIIGGVPKYTVIDREHRKHALYDEIKRKGNSVTEEYLIARFAIDNHISKNSVCDYRDELLAEKLITRITGESGDIILQVL